MHPDRWTLPIRYLLAIGFAFSSLLSFAQDPRPKKDPIIVNPRTNQRINVQMDYGVRDTTGSDSVVQFIVRLRTSPSAKNSSGRVNQASQIKQEHDDFLTRLNDLSNNARTSGEAKTIKVVREYKRSFNGFALKGNRSFTDAIKRMPHVISVTEDRKVKANDQYSNEVIKAPKVWSEVGATGQGVVIGIIDTGIDYNHPDLGGGIGSNKKVIKGYDFINDDNDPVDDHGHGTHVAGIAAANGTTKGVAPDAKLIAIKVLDQYGSGWDSQILAGIEYAMDPDGDPETNDAPDVVNMSLGRAPDANEPMSEAVNNAVQQGICFVISAGNSYSYWTVGTPGIAEQAITVAAIDNYEITAIFSSRGPVRDSYRLKPDIAAPGVSISSTYLNSEYRAFDGTSMASPHVAGVAALILDEHPEWTPADIKAAMMSTAKGSSPSTFLEIGAGIVDAYKAITTDIIMSPGSISYGRPETNQQTWSRHDVITVTNHAQTSQEMKLELEGMFEEGIAIQISPSQFTLGAGQSREVSVDIEVETSFLETRVVPSGYFGDIVLTSGSKRLKTLLSMFNPAVTTLSFPDKVSQQVFVGKIDGGFWEVFYPTDHQFNLMLPTGTYDMLAYYGYDSVAIIEDYEATVQSKTVVIDARTIKNRVDFKPLDASGDPITFDYTQTLGNTTLSGPILVQFWFGIMPTYHFSDTKKYRMYLRMFNIAADKEKAYDISLTSGEEISGSKVTSNNIEEFSETTMTNLSLNEGESQGLNLYVVAPPFTGWNNIPVDFPNPAKLYSWDDPADDRTGSFYKLTPAQGSAGFAWETSMRKVRPDDVTAFVDYWGTPLAYADHEPFDHKLGGSLVNFTGAMENWYGQLRVVERGFEGAYNHAFGERTSGSIAWTLKSNEEIVASGVAQNPISEDFNSFFIGREIVSGTHELTMKWDSYYVGGRFSDVTTELKANVSWSSYDYDPPTIAQFDLKSNGRVTNNVEEGKGGMISIKVSDYYSTTTTLEIQGLGDETWELLPLFASGDAMIAEIPTDILPGNYSLRLKSTDSQGNSVTHSLKPAFAVGVQPVVVPYTKVALISPINNDINAGVNPVFTWSAIPDATYTLQLSKSPTLESLVAEVEVSEATWSSPTALDKDALYYWRVGAKVNGIAVPWSKTFSFQAAELMAASLISPETGRSNVSHDPTEFSWTPGNTFEYQILEIGTDDQFSGFIYSMWVPPGQSQYSMYLWEGQKFYWRVKTLYYTFYNSYQIPSEVFSFTTPSPPVYIPPDPVTGLEDESDIATSFPNPFSDRTYIRLFSKNDDVARVSLIDHLGRAVRTSQHTLTKGQNFLPIDAEPSDSRDLSLSQGMYVALIETGSQQTYRVKLMKQ